ncbi:MAG: glycoside hydrolase family 31 protein [Agriterribacter sp.]
MNKKLVFTLCTFLGLAQILSAQDQPLQWQQVQPGIWKATIGKKQAISLLSVANNTASVEGLQKLPGADFPLPQTDVVSQTSNDHVSLRFPLDEKETIFGFGLNFQTVNQRGRILNLHVDHYGGTDNGRTHAPVPFYISSNGYGVLIDAARYLTVYVGTAVRKDSKHPPVLKDRNTDKTWEAQPYSDAVEVNVPGDGVDVYVFAGPTPMQVVQRYNLFNGGGYLPPKWGLGFTQRVPTVYNQYEIIREADDFEAHDFPLDFIGVEPGWQSMAYPCTLEWDSTRFPAPKAFNQQLFQKGIRTNLWLNPYISPKGSLYEKIKPLSGSHTVWNGIVPDITLPQTQEILKKHFITNHIDIGVSGYKIDEVDGYDGWLWPDVATFPSGLSAEQMRQIYGLQIQKLTAQWFKEKNQRTYGLVRASNAGASGLPYVIYNDYYSHRDFITALINSSFIGVLWTPEVRASESAEEWVRRMQSVCFSPMAMLNAWADGTKPWTFPEVEKAVKDVAMLRMQLLPYTYSTFAQYHFEGKPPFRAMALTDGFGFGSQKEENAFDATKNPYGLSTVSEIKDQYMMGDYILVAPIFTGEKTRKIYLPAGKWYDFYTGAFVGENKMVEITPSLDKIPLFVKDGAIIPMIPAQRQTPKPSQVLQLEVRHYGTKEGSFKLYDDDGETFNYEKGEYSELMLSVIKNKKGQLEGNQLKPLKGKPFHYLPKVNWIFMTK